MTNDEKLLKAKELVESEPDEALRLCNEVLNEEFNSKTGQMALFMSGYLMMQAERFGLAYQIFKRCAELNPSLPDIYVNMGMCLEEKRPFEAEKLFRKAAKMGGKNVNPLINLGLIMLQTGRPKECINLCQQALKSYPESRAAVHNIGLAKLMLRDWSGWKEYHDTLGVKHREKKDYGFPDWNGEPGTVLVYGEQGVGDEIMFASCLPDLMKTNKVIFDCDRRLKTIFERAFPDVEIHGERFSKEPLQLTEAPDYQCAIGQLPYFFRKKDSDFDGVAYLRPCPERAKQWGVVLSSKPKIGIAWTGGTKTTRTEFRSMDLSTLDPLLELDAEFVNLEYRPVDDDDLKAKGIKNWPRAVLKGADLEDTMGLISQLDCVVTACTTVVYLAGAMGVPCYVMVPEYPGYRYHIKGDSFPWYKSVKLFRGKFDQSIGGIVDHVKRVHRVRSKRDSSIPRALQLNNEAGKRSGVFYSNLETAAS